MGRPPKSLARNTRREIVDAALDLFAQQGFHGTSMRQIGRAVGVRESALYHHFASKDAILEALTKELGPGKFDELTAADIGALLEAAGAKQVLENLAHALFEQWSDPAEQKFMRIIMAEGLRGGPSGRIHPIAVLGHALGRVSGLFTEMMRRKQIRKADPEIVARAFMGPMMMMRMMYLVLSGAPPDKKKLRALVQGHLDFFWHAVRP